MPSNNISYEIDKIIFNCLSVNKLIKEYNIGLFFNIPNGTNFPYIHIGKTNIYNISPKGLALYKITKEIDVYAKTNNHNFSSIFGEIQISLNKNNSYIKNSNIVDINMREYSINTKAEASIYQLSSKFDFYWEDKL